MSILCNPLIWSTSYLLWEYLKNGFEGLGIESSVFSVNCLASSIHKGQLFTFSLLTINNSRYSLLKGKIQSPQFELVYPSVVIHEWLFYIKYKYFCCWIGNVMKNNSCNVQNLIGKNHERNAGKKENCKIKLMFQTEFWVIDDSH